MKPSLREVRPEHGDVRERIADGSQYAHSFSNDKKDGHVRNSVILQVFRRWLMVTDMFRSITLKLEIFPKLYLPMAKMILHDAIEFGQLSFLGNFEVTCEFTGALTCNSGIRTPVTRRSHIYRLK